MLSFYFALFLPKLCQLYRGQRIHDRIAQDTFVVEPVQPLPSSRSDLMQQLTGNAFESDASSAGAAEYSAASTLDIHTLRSHLQSEILRESSAYLTVMKEIVKTGDVNVTGMFV